MLEQMFPSPEGQSILRSDVPPSDIVELLMTRASRAVVGDVFLLSMNLIGREMLHSGNSPKYSDEIISTEYLGVVKKVPFVGGDETSIVCIFILNSEHYVKNGNDVVEDGEIGVYRNAFNLEYTDPNKPIDIKHLPFRHMSERNELYPFELVVGRDHVEQYVAERTYLTDFYIESRRMLNLPALEDERLGIADAAFIRKLVLTLYSDFHLLHTPEDDIEQLVAVPSWQRLIDDIAAGRTISGKRPGGEQIERRIRKQLKKLKNLGVFDDGLVYNMPQAPGLTLDVSDFLENLESMFAIQK